MYENAVYLNEITRHFQWYYKYRPNYWLSKMAVSNFRILCSKQFASMVVELLTFVSDRENLIVCSLGQLFFCCCAMCSSFCSDIWKQCLPESSLTFDQGFTWAFLAISDIVFGSFIHSDLIFSNQTQSLSSALYVKHKGKTCCSHNISNPQWHQQKSQRIQQIFVIVCVCVSC